MLEIECRDTSHEARGGLFSRSGGEPRATRAKVHHYLLVSHLTRACFPMLAALCVARAPARGVHVAPDSLTTLLEM